MHDAQLFACQNELSCYGQLINFARYAFSYSLVVRERVLNLAHEGH